MHNLQSIDLDIPRNKLVIFTGVSGSGKSSLAFDTLYAEGQRRYVESLSTYARQFLGQMDKPDVDILEGLSPAVSIEQKTTGNNPRSTVGTITEIYDYLRLLFAKAGSPHCPKCERPIQSQSPEEIVNSLLSQPVGEKVILLAPLITARKGNHETLLSKLRKDGFVRVRLNGDILSLQDNIQLNPKKIHTIEAVVDRLVIKPSIRRRLEQSVATTLNLTKSTLLAYFPKDGKDILYSEHTACLQCGISLPELSTQLFSFNNPQGACTACGGLGLQRVIDPTLIIPDPSLSIDNGAIAPWNRRKLSSYASQWAHSLAKYYNFSLKTPFSDLSPAVQAIIMNGSGEEKINFYKRIDSTSYTRTIFEGIIPRLMRLFKETSSKTVREETAKFMRAQPCSACCGSRLNPNALSVKIDRMSIYKLSTLSIDQLYTHLSKINFLPNITPITTPIIKEVTDRLSFLQQVGLGYISLDRKAGTLSGGEAQRIRLASQIGSRLAGVMYVLDEPSIGLHQRDNINLIKTLESLRELGNTVIVVEHDTDTILAADHIVDIGPGAGKNGGILLYSGPVPGLLDHENSLTGRYLTGRLKIPVPLTRRTVDLTPEKSITFSKCNKNNLKNIKVTFPLSVMTCVTGVSGSGKSSLVMETLFKETQEILTQGHRKQYLPPTISGLEHIDKIIVIDQNPIGRTPRSNPATYTGILTPIRELFSRLPESRARGYKPSHFSFNVKGGRCDSCEGDGLIKIAMHFLPDVYVTCDACKAKRYNSETLEIEYKGKTIADILDMTVEEALRIFDNIPVLKKKLGTLHDVGLGYITLGQSSITLSGGEAQRIKLAKELSKRSTGRTLYILDEPTTGLHPADIQYLMGILNRLVDGSNTVIIIEHNLDVIKCADYIIDIGPEGGEEGGEIVCCGTPEQIALITNSHTAKFLKQYL